MKRKKAEPKSRVTSKLRKDKQASKSAHVEESRTSLEQENDCANDTSEVLEVPGDAQH